MLIKILSHFDNLLGACFYARTAGGTFIHVHYRKIVGYRDCLCFALLLTDFATDTARIAGGSYNCTLILGCAGHKSGGFGIIKLDKCFGADVGTSATTCTL